MSKLNVKFSYAGQPAAEVTLHSFRFIKYIELPQPPVSTNTFLPLSQKAYLYRQSHLLPLQLRN
jgi:ureidoglycolate hydrolase